MIEVDFTYHYFKHKRIKDYLEKIEKVVEEIMQRNGKIVVYLVMEQEKT